MNKWFGTACTLLMALGLVGAAVSAEPAQATPIRDTGISAVKLDLVLIVDLSGSYDDDLVNIQGKAPALFDSIRAEVADSQFGLATFVDFPFDPWGSTGDWAYRLDQDLTAEKAQWLASINAMTTAGGNDNPQDQYEALYQAATGAGRDLYPMDGDYDDPGEIAPGQKPSFRDDAVKVIAITTDATFHVAGESGGLFPYPGPSRDETVNALNAADIKVIAIKAPGAGAEMDDLASSTDGAVTYTDASSTEIAEAILSALGEILTPPVKKVEEIIVEEEGLTLAFPPVSGTISTGDEVTLPTVTTTETGRLLLVAVWGGSTFDICVPPYDCVSGSSGELELDIPAAPPGSYTGTVTCTEGCDAGEEYGAGIGIPESVPPVPEASTLLLMASGMTAAAGYVTLRWRLRKTR